MWKWRELGEKVLKFLEKSFGEPYRVPGQSQEEHSLPICVVVAAAAKQVPGTTHQWELTSVGNNDVAKAAQHLRQLAGGRVIRIVSNSRVSGHMDVTAAALERALQEAGHSVEVAHRNLAFPPNGSDLAALQALAGDGDLVVMVAMAEVVRRDLRRQRAQIASAVGPVPGMVLPIELHWPVGGLGGAAGSILRKYGG